MNAKKVLLLLGFAILPCFATVELIYTNLDSSLRQDTYAAFFLLPYNSNSPKDYPSPDGDTLGSPKCWMTPDYYIDAPDYCANMYLHNWEDKAVYDFTQGTTSFQPSVTIRAFNNKRFYCTDLKIDPASVVTKPDDSVTIFFRPKMDHWGTAVERAQFEYHGSVNLRNKDKTLAFQNEGACKELPNS